MWTITICLPTRGLICAQTIETIQTTIAHCQRERSDVEILPRWNIVSGLPIPDSHNTAAQRGLDTGAELLFWVEEDNLLPEASLFEMLKLIETGADWAFVDYPVTPQQTCKSLARVESTPAEMCYHYSKPLRRVVWTGFGTTLIRREVFTRRVAHPWFKTNYRLRVRNWGSDDEELIPVQKDFTGLGGQDITFGWEATKAGARIEVVRGLTGKQLRLVKRGVEGTNNGPHEFAVWE